MYKTHHRGRELTETLYNAKNEAGDGGVGKEQRIGVKKNQLYEEKKNERLYGKWRNQARINVLRQYAASRGSLTNIFIQTVNIAIL
jgi:bisphosphoglycerate-dependent phosphoglycerate mutase